MKKLIIAAVGVAIVSVGVVYQENIKDIFDNTVEVTNTRPETIIETVREDELEVRIEEAQAEARGGIEADALATYELEVAAAETKREKFVTDGLNEVADGVKGEYIAEIEATITSTDYWTVSRVKRLLRSKANEYGVSYYVMDSIVKCETAGTYDPSIPSGHVYHAGNVPRGYSIGDKEDSHGLVQIHLPAHTHVSYEEATNAIYAADFLARNIAVGRASMWSCYNKLAINN